MSVAVVRPTVLQTCQSADLLWFTVRAAAVFMNSGLLGIVVHAY